ncbi:hypothetical protein BaRGS_00002674 [Batillaria attramentaria]|uniref:Uncharacterized protein n=1 Tax=Batillaria attramentaria TaxID=370345 RepID=A0ABD0M2K4_9CAEN
MSMSPPILSPEVTITRHRPRCRFEKFLTVMSKSPPMLMSKSPPMLPQPQAHKQQTKKEVLQPNEAARLVRPQGWTWRVKILLTPARSSTTFCLCPNATQHVPSPRIAPVSLKASSTSRLDLKSQISLSPNQIIYYLLALSPNNPTRPMA